MILGSVYFIFIFFISKRNSLKMADKTTLKRVRVYMMYAAEAPRSVQKNQEETKNSPTPSLNPNFRICLLKKWLTLIGEETLLRKSKSMEFGLKRKQPLGGRW